MIEPVSQDDIKINPEYSKLVPRPSPEDYNALEASLLNEGQKVKIIVNQNRSIVDGFTRYEILTKHGIEPKFEVRRFKDVCEEKKFIIEVNLKRRHLTPIQKIKTLEPLIKVEEEIAKFRSKANLKYSGKKISTVAFATVDRGRTLERVLKPHGISKDTYYRGQEILKSKNKDLIAKVESGKLSINFASQLLKKDKLQKRPSPDPPTDETDLIYMDFSWEFGITTAITPKYRTMTIEEGKAMHLAAKKNCVMFFWTTMSNIQQAQELINHWGFEIKSEIIWVKTKDGKVSVDDNDLHPNYGHYAQGSHEKLYICTKGSPGTPLFKPKSVLYAKKTEHSAKPELFGHLINKMYPHKSKREYFARNDHPSYDNGSWDFFGDELNNCENK